MNKNKILKLILILVSLVAALAVINQARQKRLNVILIVLDALRYDHLSCYGYKRNTSANIDMIAQKGVLFTQAIAQSSHTGPAVSSIMTSAMPHTHLVFGWGGVLNLKLSTLAEVLKANGFKTAFFSVNITLKKIIQGLRRGFDTFFVTSLEEKTLTNKVIQFISQNRNKPFFIYVHYMNTHTPYIASKQFESLFINDSLYDKQKSLPIVKPSYDGFGFKGIPDNLASEYGGITNPDYYIAKYDQGLRTIDEEIGKILRALEEYRLDKDTILVITSDHGEMLGENNLYFHHGSFLYEPLIRVPLIIKCERTLPQNKVIDLQISGSIDIMPTIMDILRIKRVKGMEGISLLPVISGKKNNSSLYVFSEEGRGEKCVRTKEWKLDYFSRDPKPGYNLYNLKNDPDEVNNLSLKEVSEFNLLKEKLDGYKQTKLKKGYSGHLLTQEDKNDLRSLGYLQ